MSVYWSRAQVDPTPVLSWMGGNSAFGQVFNPSWIDRSPDGKVKPGLIVRTQNCTVGHDPPLSCGLGGKGDPEHGKGSPVHSCCACNMRSVNDSLQKRSILTFSQLEGSDGSQTKSPKFTPLTSKSIVFEPVDDPPLNDDFKGTEDPRVAMDPKTGIYYMFYVRVMVLELAMDLDLDTSNLRTSSLATVFVLCMPCRHAFTRELTRMVPVDRFALHPRKTRPAQRLGHAMAQLFQATTSQERCLSGTLRHTT